MSNQSTTELVEHLRNFAEMPLEGGCADPLIEAMNGLGHRAADEIERLRAFIQQIADAPDAMVCRLTRDAAREALQDL